MPRKSHESGGESPVPLPRAQDNVPSLTPRRSARRAAASESETEAPRVTRTKAKAEAEPELDVDALPASLTANGNEQKAAPKVTGNIPHDFKGLPPFTLKQLRDAIPAHCFQRSFWRSFSYVIADGIALAAMYYGMFWLTQQREWLALPYAARVAGWAVWGWVTGVFGTGWWVLAHGGYLERATRPV